MLNQLQTHKQILLDLVTNDLEPLSGAFERLRFLGELREANGEHYSHERLVARYGQGPVDEALAGCQAELLERLLEMPLAQQRDDLAAYLNTLPRGLAASADEVLAALKESVPRETASYLTELYYSNLRVLADLLKEDPTRGR